MKVIIKDGRRSSITLDISIDELAPEYKNQSVSNDSTSERARPSSLGSFPNPDTPLINNGTVERTVCSTPPSRDRLINSVQSSPLINPKSIYKGYVPPIALCEEKHAVQVLKAEVLKRVKITKPYTASNDLDFIEFELSNFVIYLPPTSANHPNELRPLQSLATQSGHSHLLMDGFLSAGGLKHYVQAVPFEICSIGNYGEDMHEVGNEIWIQSALNIKTDIFYRLTEPAKEYARFHSGFQWLANLSKHFVDYCQFSSNAGRYVSIHDFRKDFALWIEIKHSGASPDFDAWYKVYGSSDFRRAVAANIKFLYKESLGVANSLRKHHIWSEVMDMDFIPFQEPKQRQTIVTPYVYECFKHLRFGHVLRAVSPIQPFGLSTAVVEEVTDLVSKPANSYPVGKTPNTNEINGDREVAHKSLIQCIKVGDVLSITKEVAGSFWRDEVSRWRESDSCWYFYVQEIHKSKIGLTFAGFYFYRPGETSCGLMKYPYSNELFFSDCCTCNGGHIPEDRVTDIVKVLWHGHPSTAGEQLFVRQSWIDNERFVTFRDSHKRCVHLQNRQIPPKRFNLGETVLAPSSANPRNDRLEPCEVIGYIEEGPKLMIKLRRFLRRNEIPGQAGFAPNEVVYTDRYYQIEARLVTRSCLVRIYGRLQAEKKNIPAPYGRDGTGSAFYITKRLCEEKDIPELISIVKNFPDGLSEGFDPLVKSKRAKLRGLDLYCGGGNFGRGLEESGVLHMVNAIDYGKTQIHTYYSNLEDGDGTKLFYGSVDDHLLQALNGNPSNSELIPLPGDIDFISAGSPCQGYSVLNPLKNSESGLKNQSLVASVAAYIDFYRPKYGILENVLSMATKGLGRDEDVLSQLICTLVGIGYQLEVFLIDAWSCGSPQSRSRIFVTFAAPGCTPLRHPELSHSHPPKVRSRGLGTMSNGEPFGRRLRGPTPFDFVPSGLATADLPDIGDGQARQCVPYPDHIISIGVTESMRRQIKAIPIFPRGSSFATAWKEGEGTMTAEQRALFPPSANKHGNKSQRVAPSSNGWGRINPKSLFETIACSQSPGDAIMGRTLHWEQPRPLTVMEARRAQSFPDEDVLLGSPADR